MLPHRFVHTASSAIDPPTDEAPRIGAQHISKHYVWPKNAILRWNQGSFAFRDRNTSGPSRSSKISDFRSSSIRKHQLEYKYRPAPPVTHHSIRESSKNRSSGPIRTFLDRRERLKPSYHSSSSSPEVPMEDADINGVGNYIYGMEGDPYVKSPEAEEARSFTTVVGHTAADTIYLRDDMYDVIRHSTERLENILQNRDPIVPHHILLRSVAIRMRILTKLSQMRLEAVGPYSQLWNLCHAYRQLVQHAWELQTNPNPAEFTPYRKRFMLVYQGSLTQSLALDLSTDVRDTILETIPGINVKMIRGTLSDLVQTMRIAQFQIRVSAGILYNLALAEIGGSALGHIHGYLLWNSYGFERPLKQLERLRRWYDNQRAPLFPLSTQYPGSIFQMISAIESRVLMLAQALSRIAMRFKELRQETYHNAYVAGRSGALAPYATHIRTHLVDHFKEVYYRHRYSEKDTTNKLRRWGYEPSNWYSSLLSTRRPFAEPQIKYRLLKYPKQHNSRRKQRSEQQEYREQWPERREYREQLSSSRHVNYYYTDNHEAKAQIHKCNFIDESPLREEQRRQNLRQELRDRRKSALGKMRKHLSATLVSCEAQKLKSTRGVDSLTSLPKVETPSKSTQVGKTIAALELHDIREEQNSTIKTTYTERAEPLRKGSKRPLVRCCIDRNSSPMRVSPQLRPRFKPRFEPTRPMRAPHPTMMSFSSDVWEQSIDVLTNADVNDQENGGGHSSTSSPDGNGSAYKPDAEYPRSGSTGEQHPEHPQDQTDKQSPPTPNENMDRAADEIPSSESEYEEPGSEVDDNSDPEESEEEHTPLNYQIPPEVLINALQAPPQTRASYWSQKLYRGPKDEELLLHYCSNMEVSERVAKHFLKEKVVGFDIEWKAFGAPDSIKENASLIQLASENRIALFHIARFPGKTSDQLLPPTLKVILESPETLKVGVAIKGDCTRLEKYLDLEIRGVFELSRLHNLVEYYATDPSKVSNKLVGLAKQVHQHLLLPLYKGEPLLDEPQRLGSVRESDWSKPLDYEQIHYAAADAYAGFRLFDILESKRKKLKPTPSIPRVCDYDNRPAPRTTPRVKRAKKARPELEKVVAESLSGLEAEDAEEEAYETAAEEFAEEEEGEDESTSEVSDDVEYPNADCVPKRSDQIDLSQRSSDMSAVSEAHAHRIGRVDFSRLTGADPGYPKLRTLTDEEDTSYDESETSEPPPPTAPLRRDAGEEIVQEAEIVSASKDESDDEFPDMELEEAFSSMDLDPKLAEVANNPVTSEQPDAGQLDTSTPTEPQELSKPSASTVAPPPTFSSLITPGTTPHTTGYNIATTWAQTHFSSTIPSPSSTAPSRIRATIPPLRAYHLWHYQRVPLNAIGAHLRDPPLAQSTVSSYILQAINLEKLEYRDADLIALMGTLPANLRLGRYGWLSRKLGIVR